MATYPRIVEGKIDKLLPGPEIVILYGPRRVGKTTLLQKFKRKIEQDNYKNAFFSLDDPGSQAVFTDFSVEKLKAIFLGLGFDLQKRSFLFLDEIVYLEKIDQLLKLIFDHFPSVKVLASSSSSLLLLNSLTESLAGRKFFVEVLPLSLSEVFNFQTKDFFSFKGDAVQAPRLTPAFFEIGIYGSYPEIVQTLDKESKRLKLKDIIDSALFKDIFLLEGIKNPKALINLLNLLSYQIGFLVNLNELSATLGISRRLVEEYIGLLEKFFVIFRLPPFSRNIRSEIGSKFKVYFWDLGIRNSLISRFEPLISRDDRGAVLENLVISGVARRNLYQGSPYQLFFWRSYSGFEVDLVLQSVERPELTAVEVKFEGKRARVSRSFDVYSPKRKIVADKSNSYLFYR